ncbi:NACHT domain-containing protein [Pseudovibrio ascidiaceicola]|uniref:NACHT domain-containing protein n=1 Tax=Pseudovibrio ascidiaceicola TaxID=285279 RepID=UPI003D3672DD
MKKPTRERRLRFWEGQEPSVVTQDFLKDSNRSLVVLGEAGMGKSTLLKSLESENCIAYCTARAFLRAPDLKRLIGDASTLAIDALDEVPALHDGDVIDQVLTRLVELGLPQFILSCRVADWRSATALEGISEEYGSVPLELHLEPFLREDAVAFLSDELSDEEAEHTVCRLEELGLSGLWCNPQTLDMVKTVAQQGELPNSKGDLFSEATKMLRKEHRQVKADTVLASLSETEVLDAAGAAFATLILTGKEALSRDVVPNEFDIPVAEISVLPGAGQIIDILGSRLFEALSPKRFTYTHRAIAEFLGAHWLAKQADTPRKKRRLLQLFHCHALVPASLRGLHAWLGYHAPTLTNQIISADPIGVLEYADADKLSETQSRTLLTELRKLSEENPRFKDWAEYRADGLVQPALLPEIRKIITDKSHEPSLRLLILEVLKSSDLVPKLQDELLDLLRDANEVYAIRSRARNRLIELNTSIEWTSIVAELLKEGGEDCVRLGGELIDDVGYERFNDIEILALVKAHNELPEDGVNNLFSLGRNLPANRIPALLDGIAAMLAETGINEGHKAADEFALDERGGIEELTDLVFELIAKYLSKKELTAERLWRWLMLFDPDRGLQGASIKAIAEILRTTDELRRAVQHYALLELESDQNIWQRAWPMRKFGLYPNENDVLWLLKKIKNEDPHWRDLVQLSNHGAEDGKLIRSAALRFAEDNVEDQEWLDELANPKVPQWQVEQEQRKQTEAAEREATHKKTRSEYADRIEEVRKGDYGGIVNPAKAYLNLFSDIGDETSDGPARVEQWLGPDLCQAVLEGFEAFLTKEEAKPTATHIACSYAEGRRWNAAYIIVAALAERLRTGRGVEGLPYERLMAGYIELAQHPFGDKAGIGDLDVQLENELRTKGKWEDTQRLLIEPKLKAGHQHVTGLYRLMRSDEDAELAGELGCEWLENISNLSEEAEAEILGRLITVPAGITLIKKLMSDRLQTALSNELRRTWDTVGLVADFDATQERLERNLPIDPRLLWELCKRTGQSNLSSQLTSVGLELLAWTIATFRDVFLKTDWPRGMTRGNENPWDASDYLISLTNRLGNNITPEATKLLIELIDSVKDGYTEHLRVALAEQKRKRVESEWTAPDLPTVVSAVTDQAPTNAEQLQEVMLEELVEVQKAVRGSDRDWYRDFFKGKEPKQEDECRDTILKMFDGKLPFEILASPEGHLGDDKRCDIQCTLAGLMVPIELKGQWHKDLWTAADRQLDRLYSNDRRAGYGIYVVLWFGKDTSKKLRKPPQGIEVPKTADELQKALIAISNSAREGRTAIIVLDLTRPA